MEQINFKYGEADWVSFTFTEIIANVKTVIDLTGDTFLFKVAEVPGAGTPIIDKTDTNFNHDDVLLGIVKVSIVVADTQQDIKTYVGEITRTISGTRIQKSYNIPFIIEPAIT